MRNREKEINTVLEAYLPLIENENSILKGNLLDEKIKKFIVDNSNAFLIGLIADQSVKAELAWSLPYNLYNRIGTFDFEFIVKNYTVDDLEKIIKTKPSLHRYPNKMATYIYEAMKKVIIDYNGLASNIWENKSAGVIVKRLEQFKGISHKKASLGTLLLIRDLNYDISNKNEIDIAYDVHIRRIFKRVGLVEKDTQEEIILSAKRINPEFPGKLTTSFWTIGRKNCFKTNPDCSGCILNKYCKKIGIKNEKGR